jgi:hypothetical protein
LKPEEALSDTQRQGTNDWFDNTLYSRLNNKSSRAIVLIMQRLHKDDLVGHVLAQEGWEVVRFPAIAEEDEVHEIETIWGQRTFTRRQDEADRWRNGGGYYRRYWVCSWWSGSAGAITSA